MATEEYSIGYDAGYQDGWNAAIDKKPKQEQGEPVKFLANGMRFKITHTMNGGGNIHVPQSELAGRWVVLVAAEDDCHLKLKQPAQPKEEQGEPTRHELQAKGEHPAPCARFCEANAFRIAERGYQRQICELSKKLEEAPNGIAPQGSNK